MVSVAAEAGIDCAMSAKEITNPREIRLIVIYPLWILTRDKTGYSL
jgi:hypothetical protein